MARYFSRPTSLWVEDEAAWDAPICANMPTISDHEAINTGLLDANGQTIWRAPNPVGFGRDDEW